MSYDVRLERIESRPLAIVRRRASLQELSRVVPESCGTVWNVLRSQKVQGAGRHVAVYLDDEINLEVGAELSAPFAGFGEVVPSSTPSGLVATTTHLGPYSRLHDAHDAIHRWCQRNGLTPIRPCWELYGHWKTEWDSDPSLISTDIVYLLADDGTEVAPDDVAASSVA